MAERERRQQMELFLRAAARRKGMILSKQAISFAVDRASEHIERRLLNEYDKNAEVELAGLSVERFIENIYSYSRKYNIIESDIRDFIGRSNNCFFPWCSPK